MAFRSPAVSRLPVLLACAVLLPLLSGCSTSYKIRMRGVLPDASKSVASDSRVFVEKVPEISETEHDPVLEKKLEHLLAANGYTVVDKAEADYVVLYNSEATPVAARGSFGPPTSGKGGLSVTRKPGPFERSVRLHVLEAEPYRRDGTEEVIWSCHTVMPKVPNSSPRFEDLLLVGTFEHFPEDTGAVLTWRMALNDEAAKELHLLEPMGKQ